jgi:hypothetical protein
VLQVEPVLQDYVVKQGVAITQETAHGPVWTRWNISSLAFIYFPLFGSPCRRSSWDTLPSLGVWVSHATLRERYKIWASELPMWQRDASHELPGATDDFPAANNLWQTDRNIHREATGRITARRWLSSGLLRRVVWWNFTDVSEVLAVSFIRATSVNFYQTTKCNNPKDSYHNARRCENWNIIAFLQVL